MNFMNEAQKATYEKLMVRYGKPATEISPLLGGGGCIMVLFSGLWIGIETDGYAHS